MGLAQKLLRSYENELVVRYGLVAVSNRSTKNIKQRKKHANDYEYETIKDVLLDLDNVFSAINNKKINKEDLSVFKKIGLFMFADSKHEVDVSRAQISSYGLPTYMPIVFPCYSKSGEKIGVTVVIFKKMKAHPRIAPAKYKGSETYEVCYYFFDEVGAPAATNFFCEISKSGQVQQLKHFKHNVVCVKSKRQGATYIPSNKWVYQPTWDHGCGAWRADEASGRVEAALCFNVAMNRESNVNVIVENAEGYKVVFLVPIHRWKYFFKDRVDVMSGGRRVKIFHYVSGHKRRLGDKVAYVRPHTKGSTDFQWNGYSVTIVLPGKHGIALSDFGLAPDSYSKKSKLPEGVVGIEEVSSKLSRAMGMTI